MVLSPWERRSFLRGMREGGAVAREMSSGNQVRVGQSGATSRTCSSSSLSLHSVCASRFTGGNGYLHEAWGQMCTSASVRRGPSVREKYSWQWEDSWEANRSTWAFHESTPDQPDRLGMEGRELSWERVGSTIEFPWDVDSAQWLELRVTPEEEMAGELWLAVWSYTSQSVDVWDSVTCGLAHACPTAVAGTAERLDALSTALGSWCAKAL